MELIVFIIITAVLALLGFATGAPAAAVWAFAIFWGIVVTIVLLESSR